MQKEADEKSFMARQLLKLVRKKDPRASDIYGLPLGIPKGKSKMNIQDQISRQIRYGEAGTINREEPGYVYRTSKGGFTNDSGVEAGLLEEFPNKVRPDLLWTNTRAQANLEGYAMNPNSQPRRLKLPKHLEGHVTPVEGDSRSHYHPPGGVMKTDDAPSIPFSQYDPRKRTEYIEMVLDRKQTEDYIQNNPQAVEELKTHIIPEGGIKHRALIGPRGLIASTVPNKPSMYRNFPILRPAKPMLQKEAVLGLRTGMNQKEAAPSLRTAINVLKSFRSDPKIPKTISRDKGLFDGKNAYFRADKKEVVVPRGFKTNTSSPVDIALHELGHAKQRFSLPKGSSQARIDKFHKADSNMTLDLRQESNANRRVLREMQKVKASERDIQDWKNTSNRQFTEGYWNPLRTSQLERRVRELVNPHTQITSKLKWTDESALPTRDALRIAYNRYAALKGTNLGSHLLK